MHERQWDASPVMIASLVKSAQDGLRNLRERWRLALALVLAACVVAFAIQVSDEQGRMDLPLAYSLGMTCEDDIEASLWRGGCDRIAGDLAKTGRPGFFELYSAFVAVHHDPTPREASAAQFANVTPEPGFDLKATLAGQRYGLASLAGEFEGVRSAAHAAAVIDAIDQRDRALLVIGRAGLGNDALLAGALANLVHPMALVNAGRQYFAILMGTAKRSDFTATGMR